ncbi:Centrosomal protein cep57L1 [Podochytrium sp. JEL0797]|nr:Centrosomal protein cep57L1 [Podochytrium sp. JEL0797]
MSTQTQAAISRGLDLNPDFSDTYEHEFSQLIRDEIAHAESTLDSTQNTPTPNQTAPTPHSKPSLSSSQNYLQTIPPRAPSISTIPRDVSRSHSRSPSRPTLSPDYDERPAISLNPSLGILARPDPIDTPSRSRSTSRNRLNHNSGGDASMSSMWAEVDIGFSDGEEANARMPSRDRTPYRDSVSSQQPSRLEMTENTERRSRSPSRTALNTAPTTTSHPIRSLSASRSPSRPTLTPDYDSRAATTASANSIRDSSRDTNRSLSPTKSTTSGASAGKFGSVGYIPVARAASANVAERRDSNRGSTWGSVPDVRYESTGAIHDSNRAAKEGVDEALHTSHPQHPKQLPPQPKLHKSVSLDRSSSQPRLRSRSPLSRTIGIDDQSEPENLANMSPLRNDDSFHIPHQASQFSKPPLPPPINTTITPTTLSAVPLSATSRQSSHYSLASSVASSTPNLAELANPRVKGSHMNLSEQGHHMIPSVVDKVEAGGVRKRVSQLPEDEGTRAVVTALRTLQEKVSKLELDKTTLETDLRTTQTLLHRERSRGTSTQPVSSVDCAFENTATSTQRESFTPSHHYNMFQSHGDLLPQPPPRREMNSESVYQSHGNLSPKLDPQTRQDPIFQSHGDFVAPSAPQPPSEYVFQSHGELFDPDMGIGRRVEVPPTRDSEQGRERQGSAGVGMYRQENGGVSETATPTLRRVESRGMRDEGFEYSQKFALETELESTKRKAFILERQLDRFRDLQHLTASERDEAILELNLLKEEIRLGESRVSPRSPRVRPRSRSRDAVRSSRGGSSQPHWTVPEKKKYTQDESGVEGDQEDLESSPAVPHPHSKSSPPLCTSTQPRYKTPASVTEESFLEKEDVDGLLSEIEFVRKRGKDGHVRVVATARSGQKGGRGREASSSGPARSRPIGGGGSSNADHSHPDPQWKRIDPARPPLSLPSSSQNVHSTKSPSHNRSLSKSKTHSAAAGDAEYAREMPFIVGTSTNKSHSVTANLQTVYALLKAHNPALCSVCTRRKKEAADSARSHSPSHSRSGSTAASEDHAHHHQKIAEASSGLKETEKLKSVLGTFQKDFSRLKVHYQSLVRYYDSVAEEISRARRTHPASKVDKARLHEIGKELKEVIRSMEAKGDQISILREIIATSEESIPPVAKNSRQASSSKPPSTTRRSATPTPRNKYGTHESQFAGLSHKHASAPTRINSNEFESDTDDAEHMQRGRNARESTRSRQESMSPTKKLASLTLLRSSMKVQRAFGDAMK